MIKRSLLLSLLLATGAVQAQDKAAAQPDLAKAKQTAEQVCGACHGADGNSQIPVNPKLAGQHAEYLYKQLKNFKSEGGAPAERANPIMAGMAAGLSDADMQGLSRYFAGQTLKPESAKNKASIDLGQKLWRAGDVKRGIPACAACHGPAGNGIPAQYPRIGGQFAEYTEQQLKAFRSGERANDPNKMMRAVADKMSDAEIKAVSDYIAGLR